MNNYVETHQTMVDALGVAITDGDRGDLNIIEIGVKLKITSMPEGKAKEAFRLGGLVARHHKIAIAARLLGKIQDAIDEEGEADQSERRMLHLIKESANDE